MSNQVLSRDAIIKKRLGQMTDRAKEISERFGNQGLANLATKDQYIRIRGEDYRAVSLHPKTPLCGFVANGAKAIETIIHHFDTGEPGMNVRPVSKEERAVQAFLIKSALCQSRDLLGPLGLASTMFQRLEFAFDEVSLGDKNHEPVIRCDILAVGVVDGVGFPVLIELKSNREKKRLIEQMNTFVDQIDKQAVAFNNLLGACTGIPLGTERPHRMILWPSPSHENKATAKHRAEFLDAGINVLEYDKANCFEQMREGQLEIRAYWEST